MRSPSQESVRAVIGAMIVTKAGNTTQQRNPIVNAKRRSPLVACLGNARVNTSASLCRVLGLIERCPDRTARDDADERASDAASKAVLRISRPMLPLSARHGRTVYALRVSPTSTMRRMSAHQEVW